MRGKDCRIAQSLATGIEQTSNGLGFEPKSCRVTPVAERGCLSETIEFVVRAPISRFTSTHA